MLIAFSLSAFTAIFDWLKGVAPVVFEAAHARLNTEMTLPVVNPVRFFAGASPQPAHRVRGVLGPQHIFILA